MEGQGLLGLQKPLIHVLSTTCYCPLHLEYWARFLFKMALGVPVVVQWKRIQLGIMRLRVPSLASLSGLRIWHCRELWCRSQMQLRTHIAVAVAQASSCCSDWTPSLGTSICHGCGPKEQTHTHTHTQNKTKKTTLALQTSWVPFIILRRLLVLYSFQWWKVFWWRRAVGLTGSLSIGCPVAGTLGSLWETSSMFEPKH